MKRRTFLAGLAAAPVLSKAAPADESGLKWLKDPITININNPKTKIRKEVDKFGNPYTITDTLTFDDDGVLVEWNTEMEWS